MLSASARTNNVRLRLGVAGAWLTCNLTRSPHWRPDDTKALERSMLKVCIVKEVTRYKSNRQSEQSVVAVCTAYELIHSDFGMLKC